MRSARDDRLPGPGLAKTLDGAKYGVGNAARQITDEAGAIIPGATITLTGPAGLSKSATTANDGSYAFGGLPPGDYTVQVSASQLMLSEPEKLSLKAGVRTYLKRSSATP